MGRNIIIACDGTANEFGAENTNVIRLVQILEQESADQLVYYDPGIGTMPEPGLWTKIGKKISEWIDLAFATSLQRKVGEAYAFLMEHWQPGDKVYLFGFSRGSYTVRVLAGLLHELGLLPSGNENQIPYLIRLYKGKKNQGTKYDELAKTFRWSFARPTSDPDRRFPVYFVGVWDTVSSVGWVWDQARYRSTATNSSISVIRHAISIDERRAFFRQNRFFRAGAQQNFSQLWFPGVHSDIGGGYAEGNLWRCAFDWMVDEAEKNGLAIDGARRNKIAPPLPPPPAEQPWASIQHDSLKVWWLIGEIFPKLHYQKGSDGKWHRGIRLNLGRRRTINEGEMLHSSALWRIKKTKYNPSNLSHAFRTKVRALPDVPSEMAYESGATAGAPNSPAPQMST